MDKYQKKYFIFTGIIFGICFLSFMTLIFSKSLTVKHEKIIIDKSQYVVRSLCLDNKEYFFVNGEGSSIIENKDENNKVKNCNY